MKVCLKIEAVFDIIWDLFNMLQIISTLRFLNKKQEPFHGKFLFSSIMAIFLDLIDSIVYFKPLENDLIKAEL